MKLSPLAFATHLLIAGVLVGLTPAMAQDANSNAGTGPRRGEPVTLNFANADIEAVARTMAVVTGRDVVVDPRVKGTINLVTDRAIPPATAFNQFAAALRLQGFAVVEADGLYKIVPESDAKMQSNAVSTSISGNSGAASNQIVTQIFRLNYESPNNLLPVLRPLIPPNNTINVNPGNNSLVITDYADNMRRLGRIIAALDVPNASDIEVIPLKYSVATDLVPLITRLVDGSGSGGAAPGSVDASFRTTLLAEPRSNSVIMRAANPARVSLVRTLIDRLDRVPADTGNGAAGNIYVIYLKNADAVKLATTLRAAITSGSSGAGGAASGGQQQASGAIQTATNALNASAGSTASTTPVNNSNQPSTGGQIQADPSTNSLIITASEPQYRQLRAVIDKLDGRRAQVMVESLIVEVNADKAAEFGIQWQTAIGSGGAIGTNSSLAGANILALSAATAAGQLPVPSTGFNVGLGTKINGVNALGLVARFLESNGEGNVLSTPNLLTLDNEEAKIVIGQNVPFVTGQYTNTGSSTSTVSPFQTIERKDVGLTLRVRPQISENGTVKMQIFQEVSSVLASTVNNPNGPTTSKRSIESNVLVDDGSIIVIGGLLQDEYSNSTEKVPGLGDIPVLGNLFKSEIRTRNKTNLMVFLRPVVVRDNASSETLAYDRYDSMRTMQQGSQPEANVMLRGVPSSAILPVLPPGKGNSDRRVEGTRLIPPPLAPLSPINSPAPLRGALPPTADPASSREMP
jgi:general secretion pathway protein D